MKKIIYNIFKNKTYFSALLLSVTLLTLIVVFKNTIFIPLFKQDLVNNTLSEATKVSKHLSRIVNFKDINSDEIDSKVKIILDEFEIDKMHYYSQNGKILYSTEVDKIGSIIEYDYFISEVSKGKIYSNIKYSEPSLFLMEVYIPIMKEKEFIGSYEFYYNITNKIDKFNRHVEKVDFYMSIFNSIFFMIILTLLYFSSKNNIKDIQYQKELKNFKTIIDETNAYIFTKDINGSYTFANKLVLELFQTSLDELIGKNDSEFFDLEISNELKLNDNEVMKNAKSIEKEEVNVVKETGDVNTYWSVKKPLYDKEGIIIGMSGISTDITDRKNLENEIKNQQILLNTILDNVDAYIYIKDINRNFLYVNQNTAELFGKPLEKIIGYQDTEVLPKEMADIFWESDKNVFEQDTKITTEETIIDPQGEVKHYWSIKLPHILNGKRVLIGFSSDITEIYILKEQLKKEAITDSLTNLYNRKHFDAMAEIEFKRSKRQTLPMSIIILDIDYFKQINDTYGHHIGDMVLRESSKVFESQIRKEDTLFRIGGEEFTVVLPHTTTMDAVDLAERIRISIENKIFESNQKDKISITISLGISSFNPSDKTFRDILLRADKALYEAKDSGRNKTCYN